MISKKKATQIMHDNIGSGNLRKHHYGVAAAMAALADHLGGDREVWQIVGLLHDADYEETRDEPERHTLVIGEQLEEEGVRKEIIRAIQAHNHEYTAVEPESTMEWALISCDDLVGLIVAVALVHPTKLAGVSVESVIKKFNSSSFASGADRDKIRKCEHELGLPLERFVSIVLEAMKAESDRLGL